MSGSVTYRPNMVWRSSFLRHAAKVVQAVMHGLPGSRTYRYAVIFLQPKLEVNSSTLRCSRCGRQVSSDAICCTYCNPLQKNFRAFARGNKTATPPAVTRGVERGLMLSNRAHSNTGLDLGEGAAFAVILILWMAAIWALAIVGGA